MHKSFNTQSARKLRLHLFLSSAELMWRLGSCWHVSHTCGTTALPAWDTAAGSSAGGLDAAGTCKRSTHNSFWKHTFICFIFKQQENLKSGPHFQVFRVGRAEDKGRHSCPQQARPSVVPCHNHSGCLGHVCLRAAPTPPATYHSESCSAKSVQWWTPHS